MSTHRISSTTREYVRVRVAAVESGVTVDPTTATVEFAAVAVAAEPSTWTAGGWETDATTDPDSYYARILVSGPGGGGALTLADGTYDWWIRITDVTERVSRRVGTLIVT